ncbi:2'-5' RNA ligase family protein [Sporobolomyces salmoneus]|uniref:2'-5' RNA ligase family protein n=1 Tax=Sporobolomyces salmoneus TaxID=183962 RepID=UPI00317BE86D
MTQQNAQTHSHSHSQNSSHSNSGSSPSKGGHGDENKPQWHAPRDHNSKAHRHRPATQSAELSVYPLSLRVSSSLHDPINELRKRYFPAHRLKVDAHLTLFHALPHSRIEDVKKTLDRVAGETNVFRISAGKTFKMGDQGVAIDPGMGVEEGKQVHAELKKDWSEFLSQQDSKAFKAHWTIVNKEDDKEKVEKALREVKEWEAEGGTKEGEADGLVLWRYDHGKWVFEQEWDFQR